MIEITILDISLCHSTKTHNGNYFWFPLKWLFPYNNNNSNSNYLKPNPLDCNANVIGTKLTLINTLDFLLSTFKLPIWMIRLSKPFRLVLSWLLISHFLYINHFLTISLTLVTQTQSTLEYSSNVIITKRTLLNTFNFFKFTMLDD